MQRLLTAKEVSESFNLPLQRVYDLTRRGAIPVVRILRQYRYEPNALAKFVETGGTNDEDPQDEREAAA